MQLSPRLGIAILLGVGVSFASNHLAARVAFDHGASVAAAVAVRASCTALILVALMQLQGVRLAIPGALRPWSLLAGLLIATQSYCLYSAVARIPPALALLVFQTSPMLYVLISWAMRKEAPRWRALAPMALGLAGLALALDLRLEHLQARWSEIGAGVLWAFASGSSMAVVYYLNTHVLKGVDGRVRTFAMTAVTATLVIVGGTAAHAIVFPARRDRVARARLPHRVLLPGDHFALLRAAEASFHAHRRAQHRADRAAFPRLADPREYGDAAAGRRRLPDRRRDRVARHL